MGKVQIGPFLKDYNNAVIEFVKSERIEQDLERFELARKILKRFSRFPYENLSKIIKLNRDFNGLPHRLPEEIIEDNLKYNLGGTCFSLTFFLKKIFDYFKFDTYIIMADMRYAKNSHTALILNYNGNKYLLDPGYLIFDPIPLDKEVKRTSILTQLLKYDENSDRYSLWTFDGKRMVFRYSFRDSPIAFEEFIFYWTDSFHWRTMHGICLTKMDNDRFIYFHNRYYKIIDKNKKEKGNIQTDIAGAIKSVFGIPTDIIFKAEKALAENLFYDKRLGLKVPKWVK